MTLGPELKYEAMSAGDVRSVLSEIGAQAQNLGTKEGDALFKRALLLIGRLDALMLMQGTLHRELKLVIDQTGNVGQHLRKEQRK